MRSSSKGFPRKSVALAWVFPAVVALIAESRGEAAPKKTMQATPAFSPAEIQTHLRHFTAEPHPFGTAAQHQYTKQLVKDFKSAHWNVDTQDFESEAPNVHATRFGGADPKAPAKVKLKGANVIATLAGTDDCALLFAGHFDTKYYRSFRFVGANDGGSSTALLLELARVLPQRKSRLGKGSGRWLDCTLGIVLFDGEEAQLEDWEAGNAALGITDHLYGSRHFAGALGGSATTPRFADKALKGAVVVDMVGHKSQTLFLTAGSDPQLAKALFTQRGAVDLSHSPFPVEDDHVPLMERKIPVAHVIDWTNLSEWHTAKDDLDIVDARKIAAFGDVILRFLETRR